MRVALCLSGFPRTMKYGFPYLKKYLLDELGPDVFYFGYEDNHVKKGDIQDFYKAKKCVAREFNAEVMDEIWHAYGTKQTKNVVCARGRDAVLSQYYNVYNSNGLKSEYEKENGFIYDVVIRARTDYYFFRKIDPEELEVKRMEVCIPTLWDFGGVSSGFAYGDSHTMNIYSNLFNRIAEYNLIDGFRLHPESIKGYHLQKNNVTRVPIRNHYWWELTDFSHNGNENSYIKGLITNPSRRNFL